MCAIDSIKLSVSIVSVFKIIIALYILIAGSIFVDSIQLHQAYGVYFISAGAGLIFLAILSAALTVPHMYGIKRHNRFVIVVCFVIDTIIMSNLLNLGVTVGSYTIPAFDKDLQLDCLRYTPVKYPPKVCRRFFVSDRTAGFRVMWDYLYSHIHDPLEYQTMNIIQKTGCCGFFAPMGCSNITTSFPSDRPLTGITNALKARRLTCGAYKGFYPQQENCLDYYDDTVIPPVPGGCRYDLGIGECLRFFPNDDNIGCASAVEDYMAAQISTHSAMIIASAFLNLICMLLSCCMWWKRKADDVFPNFIRDDGIKVNYYTVRDEFELKPMPGILVKKGYLPDPDADDENEEEGEEGDKGKENGAVDGIEMGKLSIEENKDAEN